MAPRRWDPLAFDNARVKVARTLALPASPERTAALERATREMLEFDVGHPTLARACHELGWSDELQTVDASELALVATGPRVERLVEIGARLCATNAAAPARLRTIVRQTIERVKAPTSVVRQAIALQPRTADTDALLAAADEGLEDWLSAHPEVIHAATLLEQLVDSLWRVPDANAVIGLDSLVMPIDRARLVRYLRARRDAVRGTPPTAAGMAQAGWLDSAAALLPRSNAIVGDVMRSLWALPDYASMRRTTLELLAALLPEARWATDILIIHRKTKLTVLWHSGTELHRLDGGAELAFELPEPFRAMTAEAARSWQIGASGTTSVQRGGDTTYWTRRGVAGKLTVTVSVTRSMGDTLYHVDVECPETGHEASFPFESPDTIAIHRSGAWVWHQTIMREGRRHELHDMGTGQPAPHPQQPPRDEVMLVTEVIGPGCPTMFGAAKFLFAGESEPPTGGA